MKAKFFRCAHCGNIVMAVEESGVPVICCGEPMQELIPSAIDASKEKHVPVCSVDRDLVTVKIGSEEHPSTDTHYIQWIGISTENGVQIKQLKKGEKPQVCFKVCEGEKILNAFAYCNLHFLWQYDFPASKPKSCFK